MDSEKPNSFLWMFFVLFDFSTGKNEDLRFGGEHVTPLERRDPEKQFFRSVLIGFGIPKFLLTSETVELVELPVAKNKTRATYRLMWRDETFLFFSVLFIKFLYIDLDSYCHEKEKGSTTKTLQVHLKLI